MLYYKTGLSPGAHALKIIARGANNPYSQSTRIYVDEAQFSAESAACSFPTGTGPSGPQWMIFGYPGRQDYRDASGHPWRPGTEVVTRLALPARIRWPLAGGPMRSPNQSPARPIPSSTAMAATRRTFG